MILEVDPDFLKDPSSLDKIFVKSNTGHQIPLAGVAQFKTVNSSLSVSHQGQFPAVTISFNLAPGVALGQATEVIQKTAEELHMPSSISGSFQGTAQIFRASLTNMPLLIAAALLAVYVVLGMLHESLIGGLQGRPPHRRSGAVIQCSQAVVECF